MIKPTVKRCIDGKEHLWLIVNEDTDIIHNTRWERRWCRKCGALTQVTVDADGKASVLMSGPKGKTPHLVLPQVIQALGKPKSRKKKA